MGGDRLDDAKPPRSGDLSAEDAGPTVGPRSFRLDLSPERSLCGSVRRRLFWLNGGVEIEAVALLIERVAMLTWTIGDVFGELARVQRSGPLGLSWELSWPGGEAQVNTTMSAFKADPLLGASRSGRSGRSTCSAGHW